MFSFKKTQKNKNHYSKNPFPLHKLLPVASSLVARRSTKPRLLASAPRKTSPVATSQERREVVKWKKKKEKRNFFIFNVFNRFFWHVSIYIVLHINLNMLRVIFLYDMFHRLWVICRVLLQSLGYIYIIWIDVMWDSMGLSMFVCWIVSVGHGDLVVELWWLPTVIDILSLSTRSLCSDARGILFANIREFTAALRYLQKTASYVTNTFARTMSRNNCLHFHWHHANDIVIICCILPLLLLCLVCPLTFSRFKTMVGFDEVDAYGCVSSRHNMPSHAMRQSHLASSTFTPSRCSWTMPLKASCTIWTSCQAGCGSTRVGNEKLKDRNLKRMGNDDSTSHVRRWTGTLQDSYRTPNSMNVMFLISTLFNRLCDLEAVVPFQKVSRTSTDGKPWVGNQLLILWVLLGFLPGFIADLGEGIHRAFPFARRELNEVDVIPALGSN